MSYMKAIELFEREFEKNRLDHLKRLEVGYVSPSISMAIRDEVQERIQWAIDLLDKAQKAERAKAPTLDSEKEEC